jgi:uncharacterized protein YcfJ
MQNKNWIIVGIAALILIMVSAGASALITRNNIRDAETVTVTKEETVTKPVVHHKQVRHDDNINWNNRAAAPAPVQQAQALPPCDDKNIVGTVLGGLGGGLAGSQVGKGNGQIAATAVGVAAGAVAGNEYIPTRNVTCR